MAAMPPAHTPPNPTHYVEGPFDKPRLYDEQGQLIPFFWQRKALIDERPKMYFGRLADTTTMP